MSYPLSLFHLVESVREWIVPGSRRWGRQNMGSLFDPGFTSAGPNVRMRTGLFASYNILQKHRGTIQVESELGRGTVFTLWIPDNLPLPPAQSSGA